MKLAIRLVSVVLCLALLIQTALARGFWGGKYPRQGFVHPGYKS